MAKSKGRGPGEGSIYQRESDGRWVAVLNLGYDVTGKRRRKYLYAGTFAEASRELTRAKRDQDRGMPVPTERQTVAQFLDRWLTDVVVGSVRPRTLRSYQDAVRLHLNPALGRHRIEKLTPDHVQAMLRQKSDAGLSPKTVQNIRGILRRALGQAESWGLVGRNVAKLTVAPRGEKHEIEPFTVEESKKLLETVKGDRLEALYSVAVSLGLRQGEAFALRWADLDLERQELRVRHTLQRAGGQAVLAEPKTRKSRRTIPLPVSIARALRSHRTRQLEERLLAGDRWQPWDLVFCTTIGTPLDSRNVTRQYHAHLEAAKIPRRRFHDLRHTAATLLLAQGVDIRTIMETLGHSQISLTMNTYAHVMPQLKRDAADRMEDILFTDKASS